MHKASNLDLSAVFRIFLERRWNKKEHTYRAYKRELRRFMDFLFDIRLKKSRPPTVADFTRAAVTQYLELQSNRVSDRTGRKLSPTTLTLQLNALQSAASAIERYCPDFENPVRGIERQRKPQEAAGQLTTEELEIIRRAAHTQSIADQRARNCFAIELYYHTGLRGSEGLRLTLEQLDLEKRCFTAVLQKGRNKSNRFFPDAFIPHLKDYLLDRERILTRVFRKYDLDYPLISNHEKLQYPLVVSTYGAVPGEPETFCWSYDGLKSFLEKIHRHTGIKCNSHLFRHTAAHEHLDVTQDIRATQQMLGHSSLQQTERYTEKTAEKLQRSIDKRFEKTKRKKPAERKRRYGQG